MEKRCIDCAEYRRCRESSVSWLFFVVGLIATIALRVVTVLAHISPAYGQAAWYIGVGGFFIFFVYKYRVDRARFRLIQRRRLMEKLAQPQGLGEEERRLVGSILCALSSNKDRLNYLLIFASSALALAVAVYYDFIK